MTTHSSLFTIGLVFFTFQTESIVVPFVNELLELLRQVRAVSIFENLLAALIWALLTTILTVLLYGPVATAAKKLFKRLGFRVESPAAKEEDYEALYLGWLKADLKDRSRPLVPTPAHPKEPIDPLLKEAQRARLLRADTEDYARNSDLSESDFETRLEYGAKVPIEDLVEELKHHRQIVVLGEPGSGKSVCLRQLAYDLCEEGLNLIERGLRPRLLPVYVEMMHYDGWQNKGARQPMPVIAFLQKSLREHPSVSEAPGTHPLIQIAENLPDILTAGRATVIFDALDEMPPDSHQERYQTLKRFVMTHEGTANRFVFSCRVLDFDSSLKKDIEEVIIDRFDLERIERFLWMRAPDIAADMYQEVVKDKDLEKLVSNPFFLQAWTYVNLGSQRQDKPLVPLTLGELIKDFAQTMLTDDVGIKQKDHLALVSGGLDTLRKFLAELAFELQKRPEGRTSARTDALNDVWRNYPQWKLLLLVARRARILYKLSVSVDSLADADPPNVEPPVRIEFMHHRLQEYFAAEELAGRLERNESPEKYLDDIWWQETVVFAVAIVPDPGSIIERILSRQPDTADWFDEVMASARELATPDGPEQKSTQATKEGLPEILGLNTELVLRMFEPAKDPLDLIDEIAAHGEDWRARHLDLPVTLLFLSRIKTALTDMVKESAIHEVWSKLKTDGNSHARRRALFVAAEALGRLRRGALVQERRKIVRALRVVVEEGTTLQKVHALRALSFISSRECVPVLKRGMQDRSSWVQSTALNVLLKMNLRQSAARKVLSQFLFDRYQRQIRPQQVLNLPILIRNLHINKGLFISFLKTPGGKRLAFLSLRLTLAALFMSVFVAFSSIAFVTLYVLRVITGAIFRGLFAIAKALFFKLPRLIITTPGLPRKAVSLVYKSSIRPAFVILSLPLLTRELQPSWESLRQPRNYLALLDYLFAGLMIVALWPERKIWLGVGLVVYGLLLAASIEIPTSRVAEQYRLVLRCIGTIVITWYARRTGQEPRLFLALSLFSLIQFIWLLPLLTRAIAFVIHVLGKGLAAIGAGLKEYVVYNVTWMKEEAKTTSREQVVNSIKSNAREVLTAMWADIKADSKANLRPWLKRIALKSLGFLLFIAVGYYVMRKYNLGVSDVSRLTGPELGPILISLKPYAFFFAGCFLVAIPTALLLFGFHLIWDEWWIVERITIRMRARNYRRFRSVNEFVAYAFYVVRDKTRPVGVRVSVAAALAEVPLASKAYVDSLSDLAEEELPESVRDAISKVADEAEKRLKRRASSDEFKVDMDLISGELGNVWKPGEILRPQIRKALGLLLMLPVFWAGMVWLLTGVPQRVTDLATFTAVVLGSLLLLGYMAVAGRQGKLAKWSLLTGLILLVTAVVTQLQTSLYQPSWTSNFTNGAVALVELSSFSSLIVPAALAGMVARAGHTIYLLGSDSTVNLEVEGKPNFLTRRLERLEKQERIIRHVMTIAICAVFAQSFLLQEYLDQRGEKLPTFVATGNNVEIDLRGLPTDGRVVRVAMVQPDEPEPAATPADTQTVASVDTAAAVISALQDGGVYPFEATTVGGDVWVTFENGKWTAWWSSPVKCLEPAAAEEDTVRFDLFELCTFTKPVRLVAVVYDRKRSEFIKGMSIPERQDVAPDFTTPSDSWVLSDTISPFVRAVWSSKIYPEPKETVKSPE